jgi:hypothetical protein
MSDSYLEVDLRLERFGVDLDVDTVVDLHLLFFLSSSIDHRSFD